MPAFDFFCFIFLTIDLYSKIEGLDDVVSYHRLWPWIIKEYTDAESGFEKRRV